MREQQLATDILCLEDTVKEYPPTPVMTGPVGSPTCGLLIMSFGKARKSSRAQGTHNAAVHARKLLGQYCYFRADKLPLCKGHN
jgi:hypothetical protein